jgi:hypothetical protein
MKLNSCAIDKTDHISLLAVWELKPECYWELLTITRLRNAISLVRESPLNRLVFPTGLNPNGVWSGICKNRIAKMNQKKRDSLAKEPGASVNASAEHLRSK